MTELQSWTAEVRVVPLTITQGVEKLGPEPTRSASVAGASNAGAPMVTARAFLAGVAAVVAAL